VGAMLLGRDVGEPTTLTSPTQLVGGA